MVNPNPNSPFAVGRSSLTTETVGRGAGGNIVINAHKLILQEGGVIGARTFGAGDGGTINLSVAEDILLLEHSSLNPRFFSGISALTGSSGQAGSISIKAGERIEVSGTVPGSVNPSLIGSAVNAVDPGLQALFRLPARPSGTAGSIEIEAPQLLVSQGGAISVRNQGAGDGGNITIRAGDIALWTGGSITAATDSGTGGNITLSGNSINLNSDSQITATAGGRGNGGNIAIDTDLVLLRNDGRIAADAFAGNGGNVAISAEAVFQDNSSALIGYGY